MVDERIYLDRKGVIFEHVIDYLRNEGNYIPLFKDENDTKLFEIETKFWGIDPEKILRKKLPQKILDLLRSEPQINKGKTHISLKKWRELGSFNLLDMHKKSPINFDSKLQFGEYRSNIAHYIGQVNQEGRAHGLGRWVSSEVDNHIYEGQFKYGKFDGFGRYIWEGGDYYVGMWKDECMNGEGRKVYEKGKVESG